MSKHFQGIRTLIGAAVLCAGVTSAFAGVNSFDSIAEFSHLQGSDGWEYGFYGTPGDASTFTQMTHYNEGAFTNAWSESASAPPWTMLWGDGGHPNGINEADPRDAVRRWTSGSAGWLTVSGNYMMADPQGSTALSILIDGHSVWSGLASASNQTFLVSSAVGAGSKVDFVINSNGVDFYDSTTFSMAGNVTAVPEPETYAMLLAGLGVLGLVGKRRRADGAAR